jgi:hypothetical protein
MDRGSKIVAGIGVSVMVASTWFSGYSFGKVKGREDTLPICVEYKDVNHDDFEDILVYNASGKQRTIFYGLMPNRFLTAEQLKAEENQRIERDSLIKKAELESKYKPTTREFEDVRSGK